MYDILGNEIKEGNRVVYNGILNEFKIGTVNSIERDKIQIKSENGVLFYVIPTQVVCI